MNMPAPAKKRIAVVTSSPPMAEGGHMVIARELTKALRDAGYDAHILVTPQNAFSGTVVLNCTPITPGLYATCSLLPSSITLGGTAQTATATINTITRVNLNKPAQIASTTKGTRDRNDTTLLCLLPAALFFFWKTRTSRHRKPFLLWAALFSATTLTLSGCGSGGDASLRYTPPGVYQYQVTATSTNGVQLTQTVTLNLTVTR